ncbi:MAG: hypothetical protein K8I02_11650 [Candidatus Methylomirabilis sp.]|nr:hypothetical protein [Deltaproteobacteria bacterium]
MRFRRALEGLGFSVSDFARDGLHGVIGLRDGRGGARSVPYRFYPSASPRFTVHKELGTLGDVLVAYAWRSPQERFFLMGYDEALRILGDKAQRTRSWLSDGWYTIPNPQRERLREIEAREVGPGRLEWLRQRLGDSALSERAALSDPARDPLAPHPTSVGPPAAGEPSASPAQGLRQDECDLRKVYERLVEIFGANAEPFEAVWAVDWHRRYWRPDPVRVVLLAESHVFTAAHEVAVSVRCDDFGYDELPTPYVRFVYCLGYGEDGLLTSRVNDNRGTSQYWKLLYACCSAFEDDKRAAPVLATYTSDLETRLSNKVALLSELFERGIWLVDASIMGIYRPGGERPAPRLVERAGETSWRNHVVHRIRDAAPHAVVCIGENVRSLAAPDLREIVGMHLYDVPQPNAYLTRERQDQVHQQLHEVCSRYAP